ncbi:hypothetical protein [Aquibacillus rhizosphaerae]|uniref:ABC transporter permease n=1 Tax=Aquibacillus rhizosphaerae TaxID=3051431 RepID=A0ABT7L900_9BACI|nr:hypothetical protein [Aquibacillus sp. LR5S19]MDL4841849.1 hypothetical protein [Aquibacillus sp. LR5S19]
MKRQVKAMLYFFATDSRYSFFIFWTIMSLVIVVSLIATYYLQNVENGKFYLAVSGAIYIYCAILGFLTVRESLSFSLKMGGTRKNYFVATGVYFLVVSFIMAFLETIVHAIIMAFTKWLNLSNFTLLHPAMILGEDSSIIYRFVIDVFIIFLLISCLYFIGLVFHKYDLIGGYIMIGLLALTMIITVATGDLFDLIRNLALNPSVNHYLIAFVIGIIIYLASWLLLYNVPAKSARAS